MTNVGDTFTFNFTGSEQIWVVPLDVLFIEIECWGASGGTATTRGIGGLGGYARGRFNVTPGETLYIYVGGAGENGALNGPATAGGFNGGGNGGPGFNNSASGGGGGGASDVRQGGNALFNRILVAGGGGGGVGNITSMTAGYPGGAGGGITGGDGTGEGRAPGTGGTQTAGGAGGVGGSNSGTPGELGLGGSGTGNFYEGGPGGGGGYYGGGAGGAGNGDDGSAGGGSAFVALAADPFTESGVNAGDGSVVITALGVATFEVNKFADRNAAAPGDSVQYSIVVTNTGFIPVSNISITDPQLGISTVVPELAAGEVYTLPTTFTIPAITPPGALTNIVTVQPELLEAKTAEAVITITESPSLLLTKSVSPLSARPGETVMYTIRAVNQGNIDFVNLRLTDSVIGLDQTIDRIDVGTDITINWPFVVPAGTPPGFLMNLTQISGDNLPPQVVGVSLSVIAAAQLAVTKQTSEAMARPGDQLTYTITIENTGNTELTQVHVTDEQILLDVTLPSLQVGQTEVVTTDYFVPLSTPPGEYSNVASVVSVETPEPVTAESSVEIISVTAVGVRKFPNLQTAVPGETVVFHVTVANLGNLPLSTIHVIDTLTGLDQTFSDFGVGDFVEFDVSYTIPVGTAIGDQVFNQIIVEAPGAEPAIAGSLVTVVSAGLFINKEANPTSVQPGETITYTLVVLNTSTFTQTSIVVTDTLTGFSETIPALLPGETAIRTTPFTVPASTPSGTTIINTLLVSSDQTEQQRVNLDTVVQTLPALPTLLTVQKLTDRTVAGPGETIQFIAVVTNTGTSPATNITVTDSLTGTESVIPGLAPGETTRAAFLFTIPAGAVQGTQIVNTVTVTYPEIPDPNLRVSSTLSVLVALPNYLLQITSTADLNPVPPGGTTNINVTVTNVSNFVLTNVRVFESLTGFTTVIPELLPGQSVSNTLPFTVPPGTRGETIFPSFATTFSNQTPINQRLLNIVAASMPDVLLTQRVDRPIASPGDTVFFIIRIANTGNVPYINGQLIALLFSLNLRTESFEVGADQTLVLPYVVPEDAEEGIVISRVIAFSDNGPRLEVATPLRIVGEEEE